MKVLLSYYATIPVSTLVETDAKFLCVLVLRQQLYLCEIQTRGENLNFKLAAGGRQHLSENGTSIAKLVHISAFQ